MEGKNCFCKSFFDDNDDDDDDDDDDDGDGNVKVPWEKVFYGQNSNNNL